MGEMAMISVDLYRNVLPDWTRLRMLDDPETEALSELLVAIVQLGTMADGGDSYARLKEIWLELLSGPDTTSRSTLAAHIDTSYDRVQSLFAHPHAFGILLASSCSRLRSPITQFHAMCLFTVTAFCSGPDERQVELCYRIGKKFGMVEPRVEELFSRMWSAFQAARAHAKGVDFPHEYVNRTHWNRDATLFPSQNPFQESAR
jgi:hypothetical protein